ncbi:hypothetical protein ACHAQA_006003 [Verticillium albo-atrum]
MSLSNSDSDHAGPAQHSTWPTHTLPVELFNEIASHLARSDVENMRVVNKEFESKLASQYFRNVVVPFKAELYAVPGDSEGPPKDQEAIAAHTLSQADNILFNGMRIFESFGHHIVRFALSLELSEDHLAYPPVKTTQKAVPTYWGIYRWPVDSYARYTELETLEDTADETLSLRQALTNLTQVKDLGLSCDAGLGYLCGPDRDASTLPAPHPVFGLRNVSYGSMQLPERKPRRTAISFPRDTDLRVLESMVRRAGYSEAQTMDAIETLLHTEGTTLSVARRSEEAIVPVTLSRPAAPPHATVALTDVWANAVLNAMNAPRPAALEQRWGPPPEQCPLRPSRLSKAQKEMILEMDWAHRALIQSYVIAILDNSLANRFASLTSLTIAKIPTSHIALLERHDLWTTLSCLKNLTLAVIPDWRAMSKPSGDYVRESSVQPMKAVPEVYELLSKYILTRPNITFFHFEWICGGEFAPGVLQRNNYVLPAPFIPSPSALFEPHTAIVGPLLEMPYIQHFSLKNCYTAPHVFNQVIRTMALRSLHTLELESVSLTAGLRKKPHLIAKAGSAGYGQPPTSQYQAIALFGALAVAAATDGADILAASMIQPAPDSDTESEPDSDDGAEPPASDGALRPPGQMSWSGFINHFSPGARVEDLMNVQPWDTKRRAPGTKIRRWLPNGRAFYDERQNGDYKLKSMSFKSCGYIWHLEISTIATLEPDEPWTDPDLTARKIELVDYMQICTEKAFGKIYNTLPAEDDLHLRNTWGMTQGWTDVYDEGTIAAAQLDGIMEPGRGRFTGIVRGAEPTPS